jgi:hypothetical protein
MASYSELLRDPRWQKLRLQVFERDKFTCVLCNANHKTLSVHHKYYEKNKMPWEYPLEALDTVCADCHPEAERWRTQLREKIGLLPIHAYPQLMGYLRGMALCVESDGACDPTLSVKADSYEDEVGIFHAWDLDFAKYDTPKHHAAIQKHIMDSMAPGNCDVAASFANHTYPVMLLETIRVMERRELLS